MDTSLLNDTKVTNVHVTQTFIWCLLMPVIHLLSLMSNILCIIVFCSKTFVHKPIAIYFICLLISDSITLLIGYSEMLDREPAMVDTSLSLCMFNGKIIHTATEFVYTFMGKFCIDWMLYKVLWTRASTILLAILSIQRTRTFFSLSYRETRFCAVLACLVSVLIALIITCFEWIGVQCEKSTDVNVYLEIFQSMLTKPLAKDFYFSVLSEQYDQAAQKYPCILQELKVKQVNQTMSDIDQFDCSTTKISSQFHSLTQSLISHRDIQISETILHLLGSISNPSNISLLIKHIQYAQSSEIIMKLFEKRSCQITLVYSACLRIFSFIHSISFSFNRHTLAIFFGNALPSFIVFLANISSLKVIYSSATLKYLKQTKQTNRRKRRLQNDLRAFLVILIESFSVITISWGIPILLTMYHCRTLYVVSVSSCPQIKTSLAYFLFTDLFNSSTNCLLYSLSGKLFRKKFLAIIRLTFTCGHGALWGIRKHSTHQIEAPASYDPSTNGNNGVLSRAGSYRHSHLFPSMQGTKLQTISKTRIVSDDGSLSVVKVSDELNNGLELQSKAMKKTTFQKQMKKPRTFRIFLSGRGNFFTSKSAEQTKLQVRSVKTNPSFSSSSSSSSTTGTRCQRNSLLQQVSNRPPSSSKLILIQTNDIPAVTKLKLTENVTSL